MFNFLFFLSFNEVSVRSLFLLDVQLNLKRIKITTYLYVQQNFFPLLINKYLSCLKLKVALAFMRQNASGCSSRL